MQRKTTDDHGSFGIQYISIVAAITGGLFILYYAIYLLFRLVFPPLLSILFATSVTAIAFGVLLVIRYIHGPFFQYEVADEPEFPDIPDFDSPIESEDTSKDTGSDESETKSTVFTKNTDTKTTYEDITEDDIPKELYVRVVKDDSYTLEDAKKDTIKQQNDDT